MATTIAAATLTVDITETITLGGVNKGSSASVDIGSIGEIDNRIMSVTDSSGGTAIFGVDTAASGLAHAKANVKYVRITNLDTSNYLILQLTDEVSHYWELKLEAGKSFVFGDVTSFDDQADIDNFAAAVIKKVIGKANSAACDIELYIAST